MPSSKILICTAAEKSFSNLSTEGTTHGDPLHVRQFSFLHQSTPSAKQVYGMHHDAAGYDATTCDLIYDNGGSY